MGFAQDGFGQTFFRQFDEFSYALAKRLKFLQENDRTYLEDVRPVPSLSEICSRDKMKRFL
jgi:hypothetical protein